MNKKAALEMSVQSIVVFVITFIVLGIIISLIVNMFDTVEDQLVILDRAPQTNPTLNKPLDVQGGKVSVRANTDSRIVFGLYLSDSVGIGNSIYFIPIDISGTTPTVQAQDTGNLGKLTGTCEGLSGQGPYTIAVNQQIAARELSAGSIIELAVTMRSNAAPGSYTCYAAAVTAGGAANNILAFGSFMLEVR